ncbi:MAG: hypothetical protein PHI11_10400 [Gallionella sp.]|nr:hypothetical protein [Gallionella sp.]
MNDDLLVSLHEKIRHLEKMRRHLVYSQAEVQTWWNVNAPFDAISDAHLTSLTAFKARFAEMQDHLASAMRLIANVENEDTRMFSYVLNYMEQIEILDNMDAWQKVRHLRNATTHDYSESEAIKSQHFEDLLQSTPYLLNVFDTIKQFVLTHYSGKMK